MKKEEMGLTKLEALMSLQEAKIDLALDTLEKIGMAAATSDGDRINLEMIISKILGNFIEEWEELCSEPV